jgi:hypothetical protein
MKTRTLTLELSKPTPPPAPEARRPARRPERPSFRPDVQRLEPRISLSGVAPPIWGSNHNETLVIPRPRRKRAEARRPARRPERPGFRPDVQRLEPRISLSGVAPLIGGTNHNETLVTPRPPRKRTDARRRPPRRGPAARFPCPLEVLEDRTAPAVLTVTTPLDLLNGGDGVLSLREAIIDANATPGADTIVVPAGTYMLTLAGTNEDAAATGDLDITADLTIRGAGAGRTIIDASSLGDRVFDVHGGTVTISGVKIQNGASTAGGGIFNRGTLTVQDSTLSGNSVVDSGSGIFEPSGGGIFNPSGGTLTVRDSTLSGNYAVSSLGHSTVGGGIFNGGTLTVQDSTLSGNYANADITEDFYVPLSFGGGIFNAFGTLTVRNSTLSGNWAGSFGGGIYNGYGTLTVTSSTLSGNQVLGPSATFTPGAGAGGGIYNSGTATVSSSALSGNYCPILGGGIFSNGTLAVTSSTLSGNSCSASGGGIAGYGGGR